MEYPFRDLMPLDEATERTGYYRDWTHIDADTFHQISELVKFIREKGYGADTREAIAQALERVYHDAAQSGNANMEVSMARGGFDTLGDRLSDTTAQLAQKVNIADLGTDRLFKGSLLKSEILAIPSPQNGDYYYATDENNYYMFGESEWINIGNSDTLLNKMVKNINVANENRFVRANGTWASLIGTQFESVELDVTKGDRFNVMGTSTDSQRLYALLNSENETVKVFPEYVGNIPKTTYDETFDIPDGVTTLKISGFVNGYTLSVKQLPTLYQYDYPTFEVPESLDNNAYLIDKLLAIGDSLTAGAYFSPEYDGDPIVENYPYYLNKINGWETTNAGTSGISASGWYENKRTLYPISECDTFVIWLGTNNGYTDTLEEDTASGDYNTYATTETGYYCKIIEYIKEQRPNANIFLCKIFASKGNVTTSNLVLDKIAVKYNLPIINMNDGTLYDNTYQSELHKLLHPYGNNVHFGKIGNLTVARKISDFINEYINNNLSQFEQVYIDE